MLLFLESHQIIETDYFSHKDKFCTCYSYNKVNFKDLNGFIEKLFFKEEQFFGVILDKELIENILQALQTSPLSFIGIRDWIENESKKEKSRKKIDWKTNWVKLALHLLYMQQQNLRGKDFSAGMVTAWKHIVQNESNDCQLIG